MGEDDKAALNRLEDQGEWERCGSYQRMFLSLHDSAYSMERVAEALLVIAAKYRPDSERTRDAAEAFYENLAQDAHARPVYMVFTYVSAAIDERVKPYAPPGGGAAVVCQAIRREYPLAPDGFRKVGKLEGRPNEQHESSCVTPVRAFFSALAGSE